MEWFQLIITYLPSVLAAIVGVENAIGNQSGATKKQVALAIITAGAAGAKGIPNETVQAIGGLVDTVVTTLNNSGVFTKTTIVDKQ